MIEGYLIGSSAESVGAFRVHRASERGRGMAQISERRDRTAKALGALPPNPRDICSKMMLVLKDQTAATLGFRKRRHRQRCTRVEFKRQAGSLP